MKQPDSQDFSQFDFIQVASVDELEDGDRLFVDTENQTIILLAVQGGFYAIQDTCTHDNGPLGDGDLDGFQLICPRHGARFDVRTGEALTLPAVIDAPAFPVRVVDGIIEIGVPKG